MRAYLMKMGYWRLVSGVESRPAADMDIEQRKWDKMQSKAAGEIFLNVSQDQRIHFSGFEEDPVHMWSALESAHIVHRPGARFNGYESLLTITKDEGESLQSLTNHIEEAMLTCQNLRPPLFTLSDLDNELQAMTMIRALPREQYASFTSALIMMLPEKLDKAKVIEAFQTEELNRMACPFLALPSSSSSSVTLAATTSPSTLTTSAAVNAVSADVICDFCNRKGHVQSACFKFAKVKEKACQSRK